MEKDNTKLITSFVDGELKDQSEIDYTKNLIDNEKDLSFDYSTQAIIKSIVSEKLKMQPVPDKIKDKIAGKINPSGKFFHHFFRG
ncbi:MAG: hypothetical protein EHM47_05350 [Ignavibacteriales bacterium]|nr:MAG: hypothetical protein EHM47_05350 [Ignavibacteriales bacterium]